MKKSATTTTTQSALIDQFLLDVAKVVVHLAESPIFVEALDARQAYLTNPTGKAERKMKVTRDKARIQCDEADLKDQGLWLNVRDIEASPDGYCEGDWAAAKVEWRKAYEVASAAQVVFDLYEGTKADRGYVLTWARTAAKDHPELLEKIEELVKDFIVSL